MLLVIDINYLSVSGYWQKWEVVMGLIRDWLNETGETWHSMAASGGGVPPSLTDEQRRRLNTFFHRQYGRSPETE